MRIRLLKHRYIVIAFVLLLGFLLVISRHYEVPLSAYFFLFLAFTGIEFYGAYFIHSNFHLRAICRADTVDKTVALTFDDGPVPQTEEVLTVLAEFNATATFFCIGSRIAGNEAILRKMDAAGHTIGNHSYSHGPLFDLKRPEGFKQDLQHAEQQIKKAIGKSPVFFRPPYGVTTPALAKAVADLNYRVIGWNIRSLDTSVKDRQKVLLRIQRRLRPGSIILLHDPVPGAGILLRELLLYLKEKNYQVVSLEQLIKQPAYA